MIFLCSSYYFRCRIANCSDPILHLQKDICGLVSNDDYSHNIRVQSLPTNIIWYKYRGIKITTSHSKASVVDLLPSSYQTNAHNNNSNFDIRSKKSSGYFCQFVKSFINCWWRHQQQSLEFFQFICHAVPMCNVYALLIAAIFAKTHINLPNFFIISFFH